LPLERGDGRAANRIDTSVDAVKAPDPDAIEDPAHLEDERKQLLGRDVAVLLCGDRRDRGIDRVARKVEYSLFGGTRREGTSLRAASDELPPP
jgi:hypothetical protein